VTFPNARAAETPLAGSFVFRSNVDVALLAVATLAPLCELIDLSEGVVRVRHELERVRARP
jgi:hypothetical protein